MAAKRVIARLILSLVGGVVLFLAVSIATLMLPTYYTNNHTIYTLLMLPSRWPRYAYVYLYPGNPKPSLIFDDTASLLTLIACDLVFYSLIVYALIAAFSVVRRRKVKYDLPPPPGNTY